MGVYGQTQALVGREAERGQCARALTVVTTEEPACLVLAGEPGIGKTALLGDLCDDGRRRELRVLRGGATEFEQDVPFAPIVDALDDVFAELGADWLERLDEAWRAELGSVFPALAGRGGDLVARLPAERYRCYRAVRAALEALAIERPLVLALDDLHWADPASLELVCHLLHRLPRAPVLLALAYRDRPSLGPLAGVVSAAERERVATVIRLGPLGEDEADALLAPDLQPSARRVLLGESGGNPFYLGELARAVSTGAISLAALTRPVAEDLKGASTWVPEGVPDSVLTMVRCCGRPGARPLRARRRRPPAGSVGRCGCCPTAIRARGGSS